MAASVAQIARLRRMVGEPTDATYDDDALAAAIERYPLIDERGEPPYTYTTVTGTAAPTPDVNEAWIATYDLNAAAADLWEEKAAAIADQFDFSADNASFRRSQKVEHARKQARAYRARRSARTITQRVEPITIPQVQSNAD